MQQRTIGNSSVGTVPVGAVGLGAMPLSTKDPRPTPGEEGPEQFFLRIGFTVIGETEYGEQIGELRL